MAHSDKVSEIGPALETFLVGRKQNLGLRDIWYGDDNDLIPQTPAIVIAPGVKERELTNTGYTTLNTFRFTLMLFHSRLTDPTVVRKECDAKAEQLEDTLHSNKRLGNLLLTSHVRSMEYGAAFRNNVALKATRLLWVATSQTRI